MGRHGPKRQLEREGEYWSLLKARVGTVEGRWSSSHRTEEQHPPPRGSDRQEDPMGSITAPEPTVSAATEH
jgi:hypothetical protein